MNPMTRKPAKPRAVWCVVSSDTGVAWSSHQKRTDAIRFREAADLPLDRVIRYIPAPARPARRRGKR